MSSHIDGNQNTFLSETYVFPEKNAEEYDVKIRQYLNNFAASINSKISGLYDELEVITGKKFLPIYSTNQSSSSIYRNIYRKVIDFGVLPNTTSKTVSHGIGFTTDYSLIQAYGGATNPGNNLIPIPYSSPASLANNISLEVLPTTIRIGTGTDRTNFTRCFVVVEYIKEL